MTLGEQDEIEPFAAPPKLVALSQGLGSWQVVFIFWASCLVS